MPSYLRLAVDVKDVSADLRAIADGLDRPISESLLRGAKQIATDARPLVAGKPAWVGSKGIHALPITYDALLATPTTAWVKSPHPGAPVQEYGGDIHPQDSGGLVTRGQRAGSVHRSSLHYAISRLIVGSPLRKMLEGGLLGPTVHIRPKHAAGRAASSDEERITRDLESAIDRLIHENHFD